MKRKLLMALFAASYLGSASMLYAQAFGDYGRTLGGIPNALPGPRAPGGVTQGGSGNSGGVGEVTGAKFPTRLVVATKSANLYPRQDDESEKIDQLAQGEPLVPLVQSSGGNDWFMVKTQRGVIGWIKSGDVKEEIVKK